MKKKPASKKAPRKSVGYLAERDKIEKEKATKKKVAKKARATRKPKEEEAPKRTKQQLGRLSRTSGHNFERLIVNTVKERFADRMWSDSVRRSDQGHQAWLPDVTGWPGLWPELQTAIEPTPIKKLEQGERDSKGKKVIPLAITRKKKARQIRVTLRAKHFAWLIARYERLTKMVPTVPVELELDEFLQLYDGAMVDEDPDAETMKAASEGADDGGTSDGDVE